MLDLVAAGLKLYHLAAVVPLPLSSPAGFPPAGTCDLHLPPEGEAWAAGDLRDALTPISSRPGLPSPFPMAVFAPGVIPSLPTRVAVAIICWLSRQ